MTEPAGSTPTRRWTEPPAFLLLIAAIVVAAGAAMAVLGSLKTGLSVDDPRHGTRLDVYYETGLYTTRKEQRVSGVDVIPNEAYVYGPVTALIQHGVNRELGNDDEALASRTATAYTTRHVVVAVMSLFGLLAVGVTASILLRSWRWGLVASAVLAAIPLWTGYAMFNVKDTPVATGHALATLGLVLMAGWRPSVVRAWTRPAWGFIALTAGTVLMVGTRPGIWPSLAASITLLVATLAWARSLRWSTVAVLGASLATSYGVLLAVYPRIFAHPLTLLWTSATSSAGYEHLRTPNGRGYLPRHLVQDWPIILVALFLAGTVFAIVRTISLMRNRSADATGLLLIGSQAFTLPVLAVAYGSAFYQGLRQVLFAVPAQAILATIGLATLVTAAHSVRTRHAFAAVAGVGLILPTAVQASLFPYQYSYVNVATEAAGVPVDRDPLGTSYRELLPAVSDQIKIVCPQFESSLARTIGDCRLRPRGQFSTYWKATGKPAWDDPKEREYYAILRGSWPIRPHCTTVREVTRWENVHRVVINRLVKCEPPNKPKDRVEKRSVNPWDEGWTG
jgi:hypothetical protein